ncbi:hypothetical protein [Thioalkalivibrio sulfidiphilus]|uniref:hypothetical protein n=1 Tax=Thioalkalivibrio sulfidiphilus TaxID=1033854 RepID=UPI0003808C9D|nr:hypothetical protein [Thioalkalivibrio sulfidiphilus]
MNLSLPGLIAGLLLTVAYYPYLQLHLAFVTMMYTFWWNEQGAAVGNLVQQGMKRRARKVTEGG